jgi:hypothetical protein
VPRPVAGHQDLSDINEGVRFWPQRRLAIRSHDSIPAFQSTAARVFHLRIHGETVGAATPRGRDCSAASLAAPILERDRALQRSAMLRAVRSATARVGLTADERMLVCRLAVLITRKRLRSAYAVHRLLSAACLGRPGTGTRFSPDVAQPLSGQAVGSSW